MPSNEHTVIRRMAEIFQAKEKKTSVIGASSESGAPIPKYMRNVMTTIGDMIRGGTSGAPVRIPIGAEGEVLTVVSGLPEWSASSGIGGQYQQYVVVGDGSGGFDLVDDGFGNPVFTLEDVE